jgi:hypothetical protein
VVLTSEEWASRRRWSSYGNEGSWMRLRPTNARVDGQAPAAHSSPTGACWQYGIHAG